MKLAQKNKLPSFAFNRRSQRLQHWVTRELTPQPPLASPAAERERNRGAYAIADEYDDKTPPQAKEKAAADAENPAWQKQDITEGKEQRVTNRAPRSRLHNALLHARDGIQEWIETRQPQKQTNRAKKNGEL